MKQCINRLRTGKGRAYLCFQILYWGALLAFLLLHRELILQPQETELVSGEIIFRCVLGMGAFLAVVCIIRGMFVKEYRGTKEKRMGIWCWIFLFVNSCYAFWILEYLNNPDLKEMYFPYMLLNAAGIMILSLIVVLWLNSFRKTMIVILVTFTAASILFSYVYACRGEPLQFIDIFAVGTALEVAGEYHFEFCRQSVVILALSGSLLGFYMHLPDWQLAKGIRGKIAIRLGVIAGMIGGCYLYLNTNWNGNLGILTDLWAPVKTYKKYGTEVGFFCVAKYMRLSAPEGYSPDDTEEIAVSFRDTEGAQAPPETVAVKPVNLIAIMNESWADYRLLGKLETTQPVMPFYDAMEENIIKGTTLVCTKGGGTAKTEYEFLTGNSEKRFPGMVPYVSYYTHEQHSLFETMQDQGYQVAAMHPNKGTNWNRNNAYRLMGVEDFYDIDDFPEDAKRVRAHISDQANYEEIIRLVEEKERADQPFFLFDITMQNHGGYKAKRYESTVDVNGYDDDTVDQYLSLLRESDSALEYLIRYFEDCPEPTMIVMFGDHYPDLPEEFMEYLTGKSYEDSSLAEQEVYYSTPFFIWANYDIPEEQDVLTSTNYLGTMMLEAAGAEMPLYNRYLSDLRKSIPALNHLGYMDADGVWHDWKEAEEPEKGLERAYECLQYNNLAENRKRLDWFFRLDGE